MSVDLQPLAVPHDENAPVRRFYGPQIALPSGLVLGSRDRAGVEWHVDELEGWNEVDSTGTFTQRSYRHGAWIDRAFYPARIMAITGRFIAPHAGARDEQYAVLEAAADRLLGSIPLEDPAEVVVTAGGRSRLVRARQDGPQVARVNPPGTWGEFSIQLVAPDPRRLSAGPAHTASTGLPSSVGGLIIPGPGPGAEQ